MVAMSLSRLEIETYVIIFAYVFMTCHAKYLARAQIWVFHRGVGSDGQAEEAESSWPSEDEESQKVLREQEQEEAESEDVQEKGALKDLMQNVKLEHRKQEQEEVDSKKDGGEAPVQISCRMWSWSTGSRYRRRRTANWTEGKAPP